MVALVGMWGEAKEVQKTREKRQPVRGRKAGLEPWHILVSVQMLQGSGATHLPWQAHLQPATEENRSLLAQHQGSKGAGAGVLGCCNAFRAGKLERLLQSKKY